MQLRLSSDYATEIRIYGQLQLHGLIRWTKAAHCSPPTLLLGTLYPHLSLRTSGKRNGRQLITIAVDNMASGTSDVPPHSSALVLPGPTPQETAPVAEPQADEARGGKGELSMTTIAAGDRALETTDELADTTPPDTFPEFVLREKSRACKRRFKECLHVPNLPHDDWLEQRSAEFNWWTSGLNADQNGPGSLDARLRLRPDVTAVLVDALEGLEDALYTYHQLGRSLDGPNFSTCT